MHSVSSHLGLIGPSPTKPPRAALCERLATGLTDQAETIHQFDYDTLGRRTQDRLATLGSAVDRAVRRIAVTYDARGLRSTVTTYDHATVGSGSVVNECTYAYNHFGQLTAEYQSHSGAVNTMTTPKVAYSHEDGADHTIRPTGIVYPNGRELTYDYGTTAGPHDALSRVASLVDDDSTTHLADYSYLGLHAFVETDDTEPDLKYTLVGTAGGNDPDTGDIYRGPDRFGRVKDSYWYDYGSSSDAHRIQYGYDRAGNRTYRHNTVAAAASKKFDEKYWYDAVQRLKDLSRGTLNTNKDNIQSGTETFAECWGLDATGNWRDFRRDDDGTGWSLVQQRTSNTVNEITDITNTSGSAWVDPAYSRAGNMTTLPQPADPTSSYAATYDVWNRLVNLVDGSDTVSEYQYDAAKRRIVQKTYTGGTLSETRHYYYTQPDQWQVNEERVGTSPDSATAERQFVWGLRYRDELVLRDRDTDAHSTLDERLYAVQDANWNVTALADTNSDALRMSSFSRWSSARSWPA